MNEHKQFQIVCTGRTMMVNDDGVHARQGTHKLRELLMLYPQPPQNDKGFWFGDPSELGKTWADWVSTQERNRSGKVVYSKTATVEIGDADKPWVFRCKSCGPRHNRLLRDETLERMVMGLIASGVSQLDISNIPANLRSS